MVSAGGLPLSMSAFFFVFLRARFPPPPSDDDDDDDNDEAAEAAADLSDADDATDATEAGEVAMAAGKMLKAEAEVVLEYAEDERAALPLAASFSPSSAPAVVSRSVVFCLRFFACGTWREEKFEHEEGGRGGGGGGGCGVSVEGRRSDEKHFF